jgi:hypothetical protein
MQRTRDEKRGRLIFSPPLNLFAAIKFSATADATGIHSSQAPAAR